MNRKLNVFCIYSNRDKKGKEEVLEVLRMTSRNSDYDIQWDGGIEKEGKWNTQQQEGLNAANLMVLLMSPRLLASDYFLEEIMPQILNKRKEGVLLSLVLLATCDWRNTPFKMFPVLPPNAKPIDTWEDPDQAIFAIGKNISNTCQEAFCRMERTDSNESQTMNQFQNKMTKKLNVLCIYAERDHAQKEDIKDHLNLVSRNADYNFCWSGGIEGNAMWDAEEVERLYAAKMILVLMSARLLASDYFMDILLPIMLSQKEEGKARVIPVILSRCDWTSTPLRIVQAVPKDARPIDTWDNRDMALFNVKSSIEMACKRALEVMV